MSGLLFDISKNVKINKKKNGAIVKWGVILLPYVLIATFLIGVGWFGYKNKITYIEKKQIEQSTTITNLKTEHSKNIELLNNRVDKVNTRVDNLYENALKNR
jgi:hypothetical protein